MHPHLQLADEAIAEAASSLSAAELSVGPAGKWTPAEILEHLTLAFSANAAGFAAVTSSGQPRARRPGLAEWTARQVVVGLGHFPRAEAPKQTRPSGTIAAADVCEAAREALRRLDAAAADAAARFGEETPLVNHPYFAGMSVRQWRKFHWRHTIHHMRQVRAISRA